MSDDEVINELVRLWAVRFGDFEPELRRAAKCILSRIRLRARLVEMCECPLVKGSYTPENVNRYIRSRIADLERQLAALEGK